MGTRVEQRRVRDAGEATSSPSQGLLSLPEGTRGLTQACRALPGFTAPGCGPRQAPSWTPSPILDECPVSQSHSLPPQKLLLHGRAEETAGSGAGRAHCTSAGEVQVVLRG